MTQISSSPYRPNRARRHALCVSVLALAAAMAAPGAAAAQEAGQSEVAQTDRVTVTGSRIVRQDFESNTPLVTVPQSVLENSSTFALEAKLLQFPQFSGSGNSQFSTGYFNSGASTLNLRNLGDNRNLVLVDGRRPQPSTNALAVDVNTIPAALIENVEIITGGASAIYGADAVSGVVNFILRDDFEGVQFDGAYGLSEHGDNQTINLSALFGGNFADGRGNAVFTLDYADRGSVRNVDRDFFRRGFEEGRLFSSSSFLSSGYYKPGENRPDQAAMNAYFGQFGATPGAVPNRTSIGFNNDGQSLFNVTGPDIYNYQNPLFPRYAIDTTVGPQTVKQNFIADTLASLPMERWSAFSKVNYQLTDTVNLFGQFSYSNYTSITQGGSPVADNRWVVNIPRGPEYPVPDAFAALLDSRPDPNAPWQLGKTLTFMGLGTMEHKNEVYQAVVGAEGEIRGTPDWTYEIYGSYGETSITTHGESGFGRHDRYMELVTAPNYGAGFSNTWGSCTSGVSPFGELSGEGRQLFLPAADAAGVVSADCIDYIEAQPTNLTNIEQQVVEGSVQGALFDLPAGEARFAAGASYRRLAYEHSPDSLFEPDAGYGTILMGQFGLAPVNGSNDAMEAYGELLLPVLRDLPLIQAFDLNLAYRFSDYKSSGGSSTYKADVSWQVIDELRLRGGYQRAARAPNVVELYTPATLVFSGGTDACQSNVPAPYANVASNPNRAQVQALCRALMGPGAPADLDVYLGGGSGSLNTFPIGNPDLDPEKADTFTVGAVFSPAWDLPANGRFRATIDYYNIDIKGAIGYVNADLAYQLCFNADGVSNPTYDPNYVYCQGILRAQEPGTGTPLGVLSPYLNQGGIKTSGVDAQIEAGLDVGPGALDLTVTVNYLDSFKRSIAPGQDFIDYTGFNGGYFDWRMFSTLTYTYDGLQGGMRWRHLDSSKDQAYLVVDCVSNCIPGVEAYDVFDAFVNWQVTDRYRFRAGIDNLFDKDPPVVGGRLGQTSSSEYDILGRRFYAGFTVSLE